MYSSCMGTNAENLEQLRYRIFTSRIGQYHVAEAVGIAPSVFSQILRGNHPLPESFAAKVLNAISRLEAAEAAADEARARVLAGEDGE